MRTIEGRASEERQQEMKSKDKRQQTLSMVEDGATERLKKRLQDIGLIVNAGLKPKADEPTSRAAKKKAISRWENEGGAILKGKNKGGKK